MWVQNPSDELCHHGILGMHWGHHSVSRTNTLSKADYKERKAIDRKLNSSNLNHFSERNKLLDQMNRDRIKDSQLNEAWKKAFKAGKKSKEWANYEKIQKEFTKKYASRYTDALLKDIGMTHISEVNHQYVHSKVNT